MNIHIVQKGDTIWQIAKMYNTSEQRIISDNNVNNIRNLVVGQALIVLTPKTVYVVKPGDTLTSIAQSFGITVIELIQNNPELITADYLRIGQPLAINFQGEKIRQLTINAYAYPYIRKDVLQRALPYLTYLTIFGYGFTESGDLIGIDDMPLIDMAYQYRAAPVMLISSITEDGNFSSERASMLFSNIELQNKVINNIIKVMLDKGYVGLDIDFEYIMSEDKEGYLNFIENVTSKLHPYGFFVNTDLAPKVSSSQKGLLYEAHDYKEVGEASDTVLIMTYEWGYTYGSPMAVAPINKVREVIEYAVSEITPQKILMGIPNYGYDWALPFERGVTKATSIGNTYAVETAARYGAQIKYDELAQSPYFEYWSKDSVKHVVWFEDVRSIQAKFDVIDEFNLLGAGYWNAMRPFAQNWAFIASQYDILKVI